MLQVNPAVDISEVCQTNVNICTIYSEMGKHEIALKYVEAAVRILDKEYERRMGFDENTQEKFQMCSLVATAFHNAAVEYEHVKDYPICLIHYQKAARIA
jgi:tetratricopeptide (TPR) repeat protein